MQISGQNNNTNPVVPQPQYNSTYNCGTAVHANGTTTQTQEQPQQATTQPTYPQGYYYPQGVPLPQASPVTSGVNIQIFNPAVIPNGNSNVNSPVYYPGGYYTGQIGPSQPAQYPPTSCPQPQVTVTNNPTQTDTTAKPEEASAEKKKTEKRNIVVLTDDYIRNLENYLNSQDKAIRLSAAKEVFARLEEDDSRKDDKALNALINKMLQDPSDDIRFLALTALDSRLVSGDSYTVGVLKKMQASDKGFGQDAIDASNILLKMSAQTAEKEFEVKSDKKKPVKNPLYDMK